MYYTYKGTIALTAKPVKLNAIYFLSDLPQHNVAFQMKNRLLTVNYSAACTEAYYILEEIEAAHKLGGVEQAT